ncbi:D-arabinose 1-dehydrogenase (NAD(P)(+)) [Maudiozyma humilis]|uniref:D-arabinose 1-dehydrogenase (NAD(P)(+)) n=1 Tax=Maudiozyma humilis TaxID=51915 RepID=A0AAV5S3E6_MAUHU|nr:D-arabinose 1-dehydrogenase (NAD(P)(+)) [Kazachstania humilis]
MNIKTATNDCNGLGDLMLGCGTFAQQYNSDPDSLPIADILRECQANGVHALDTSPYYGLSEVLVGRALSETAWSDRSKWTLCTKVGRIAPDKFDYSPEWVRQSVMRSLERLISPSFPGAKPGDAQYFLDVVYVHDVEFQTLEQALGALRELRKLQREGLVRRVGISGYPLAYLHEVALAAANSADIGPLDCILSYCNLNLQNTRLLGWEERFRGECGIPIVSNASVLSMSLLRAQETVSWHPASAALKKCARDAAEYCASKHMDLAGLAVKYAMTQWLDHGVTVVGVSSVWELREALDAWREVRDRGRLSQEEAEVAGHVREAVFASRLDQTWASGNIPGSEQL